MRIIVIRYPERQAKGYRIMDNDEWPERLCRTKASALSLRNAVSGIVREIASIHGDIFEHTLGDDNHCKVDFFHDEKPYRLSFAISPSVRIRANGIDHVVDRMDSLIGGEALQTLDGGEWAWTEVRASVAVSVFALSPRKHLMHERAVMAVATESKHAGPSLKSFKVGPSVRHSEIFFGQDARAFRAFVTRLLVSAATPPL